MTGEEAIKNLNEHKTEFTCDFGWNTSVIESLDMAIKALKQTRWIPVSEKLPKASEYIGNVRKYYLIQDEYGDMHVAHLNKVGWIPMDSLKAIGNEVIAWMPLPQPYNGESEVPDADNNWYIRG